MSTIRTSVPPGLAPPQAPPPYVPPRGPHGSGGPGWSPAPDAHDDAAGWTSRRSLAARITLLTTMAVALAVVIMAAGAYVTARTQLQHSDDQALLRRAQAAANYGNVQAEIEAHPLITSVGGASDLSVAFIDKFGAGTTTNAALDLNPGSPETQVAAGVLPKSVRTMMVGGIAFRVVAVPIKDQPGIALVFAKSLADEQRVLTRLGLVSLFFGIGGVILAALAGFGVARSGLRPVRSLTSSVEEIARTEDLRPIPIEGDDEIARLASAFNQMLTSLDASRERQRRLVTDAGHELRTPLTSLRTNVDLLTQADAENLAIRPEQRAELLGDIAAQIDELTTLIGDLTELARDEPLATVIGTVDLSEIVDVSVARVRRRAVGATFDVETESWPVVGEAPALERAITNLLDNAAKWSPSDGTVTVRLRDGVLTVDDQGPGIAPADRVKVFDRFWRAEESRAMPGSGLGLSIVRQVAERHAGTVSAEEAPGGGARLILRLPGAAATT